MQALMAITEVDVRRKSLIAAVVLHCRVQVGPASLAERLIFLVTQFFVQTAQKALVVYTHCLQEVHFKLLTITAQLSSQSVALALQFLLRDFERAKIF